MRRDHADDTNEDKERASDRRRTLCLLRVFAFLLLATATAHGKEPKVKDCIRLIKVALKASRICLESKDLVHAIKVLGCAADYEEVLGRADQDDLTNRLRLEYYGMRTMMVSQ